MQWTPNEIIRFRTENLITQEQLAEMLGVSRVTIWRWEQGRVKLRRSSMMALDRIAREEIYAGRADQAG